MEAKHFETLSVSAGRMMKTVKVIILLATVFFVLGFSVAVRPLIQEGFWPGLGVMLICLGVLLMGTGAAAQITTTPKRSQSLFDKVGWAFVEPFGRLSIGLVISAARYSIFLGVAALLCCVLFAILMFRRFQAVKEENDNV